VDGNISFWHNVADGRVAQLGERILRKGFWCFCWTLPTWYSLDNPTSPTLPRLPSRYTFCWPDGTKEGTTFKAPFSDRLKWTNPRYADTGAPALKNQRI